MEQSGLEQSGSTTIRLDAACAAEYPGLVVGFLEARGVAEEYLTGRRGLDLRRAELEQELRRRFAALDRATLSGLPPFPAYAAYYRRFKKTYHVLLQLESVVLRQRGILSPHALVQVMFMAELESRLLTAAHDAQAIEGDVVVRTANGAEEFVGLDGQDHRLKPGDLHMADEVGVISSVIYGPDSRTRVHPGTEQVLYTVYGVPGVDPSDVRLHLDRLEEYVKLVAPEATVLAKGALAG